MYSSIPFSGNPLDRAAGRRRDPEWVVARLADAASRFLPLWRLNVLTNESEAPSLLWLDASVMRHLTDGVQPVFLGLLDERAHFAVDLSDLEEPLEALGLEGARFAEVRAAAGRLPLPESGIAAHARALVDWHGRHRFCAACGAPTSPGEGGMMRRCGACDAEHFPRTDPVVIMVVWRGDRCILGRQKTWAPGAYSALAGFIEQAETIEEAVQREVKEEVGLDVDEIIYHSSQPWPFPSNLMIGCFAHATGEAEAVDAFELETARWFTRAEIQKALAAPDPSLGFSVPTSIAIAHHIIKAWSERADLASS